MVRIPEGSAPDFKNKSWTAAAEVTIPEGANGVLGTIGGRYGGWALLMQDGKPQFAYAFSNQPDHKSVVTSDQPLAAGNHILRVKLDYEGGGIGKGATATLLVDEKEVGQVGFRKRSGFASRSMRLSTSARTRGRRVLEDYADKMPFKFTGELKKFVVVLQPQKLSEEEQKRLHEELAKAMMAVQ